MCVATARTSEPSPASKSYFWGLGTNRQHDRDLDTDRPLGLCSRFVVPRWLGVSAAIVVNEQLVEARGGPMNSDLGAGLVAVGATAICLMRGGRAPVGRLIPEDNLPPHIVLIIRKGRAQTLEPPCTIGEALAPLQRTEYLVILDVVGRRRGRERERMYRALRRRAAEDDAAIESLEQAGIIAVKGARIHASPALKRRNDLNLIGV
jgi:hypothetical protein